MQHRGENDRDPVSGTDDETESSLNKTGMEKLPEHWLNVEQLICRGMPPPKMGEKGKSTVKTPGTIKYHFKGELSHWKSFQDDVLAFWTDDETIAALGRCDHLPVGLDYSTVGDLNPYVNFDRERIQCGGEITLSGRFYWNALEPVMLCVATLGQCANYGPKEVIFGDSWTQNESDRVEGLQPDIVARVRVDDDEPEVRLLGEVKFPLTVDIAGMVQMALKGHKTKFCKLLGQVVNYMLSHRLKYAFLTNYRETTFVMLYHIKTGYGTLEPRIAFSDPILDKDTVDGQKEKISVRLALLYLLLKTAAVEQDKDTNKKIGTNQKQKNQDNVDHPFKISEAAWAATRNWISTTPLKKGGVLNTPLDNRNSASDRRQVNNMPEKDDDMVRRQAHTNPFEARGRRRAGPRFDALSIDDPIFSAPEETPSKGPGDSSFRGQTSLFADDTDSDDHITAAPRHRRIPIEQRFRAPRAAVGTSRNDQVKTSKFDGRDTANSEGDTKSATEEEKEDE